jgi:DNA-binding GntR family transcriptional regulator
LRPGTETVQELIVAVVRRAVLSGIVQPGVKLRQEDLAAVFGTSRIPVREALRVLEHEGLVRSEPHRGFSATALDADQVEEIYELRIVLEAHAIRQAIPLLTEGDLQELDRLHDEMEAATDPEDQLEKRERFYLRLYSVTARPRLVGLIARLHQEVARSLRWKLVQHSPSQHQTFYEAIRKGDADAAVEELTQHYRKVAALIRRFLRQADHDKEASLPMGGGNGPA